VYGNRGGTGKRLPSFQSGCIINHPTILFLPIAESEIPKDIN
jgi:hypothetical protein